ncbi:uncharacterized protein K489DRAFT_433433 [Dissoconium aciculare CBS 342.82]|uniref:Uncharacterized protein n=1 Tax=Dissoconium aciculare CBS 342.82 TaxID=1314786 RepID=A0A6J3M1F4_9PEZI|nr:uncharacterized protein K489DRAFT_433433 [Dissoconium aciculare CBS 342.82]KAF1820747.1 hypothetical protein K489DRAFT_433433 [Dissoconium aciculare CBS 342.82]
MARSAKVLTQMNAAALAITYALDRLEVDYGFYGAYVLTVLGGLRRLTEDDRITCAVGCTKAYLMAHLKNFARFDLDHESDERPDIATYVFDKSQLRVDFYPISMTTITTQRVCLQGGGPEKRSIRILSPVFLFKAQLEQVFHHLHNADLEDLRFLQSLNAWHLRTQKSHFNRLYMGKIVFKKPAMQVFFKELNIDPESCRMKWEARKQGAIQRADAINRVQNGLLYNTHDK